jgi:tripartite-type tricarboxylate transporter receptor subunit TctC
VADNVPAGNVKELIALSRKSDKKLNFASAGTGSVAQLVWEVVKDGAKIDAVDVPYRGGGPAMAAVVAGQVDIIMASSQVAQPFVEGKRIKALAVTGTKRSPALPDVPTLPEAGVKTADVDLQFWFGVFAPKGTPVEVKAKLEKAIEKALQAPALRERLAALDITPEFGSGTALQKQLVNEIKNWKTFIEAKDIKAQ